MKTSFEKFMASSAVKSIEPTKVEMGEVKVNLSLMGDLNELKKVIESNYTAIQKDVNLLKTNVMSLNKNADKIRAIKGPLEVNKGDLNEIRNEFTKLFKDLGTEFNPSVEKEIDSLYKMLDDTKKFAVNGLIDAKNKFDTSY